MGVNGGVILPLTPGPSPMVGTLTAANFTASGAVTTYAQAVAAIRAGTTYFNLHTTANPGGEIRGQIVAAGDAYFADLNGAQENPAVATAATGKGIAVISADASTVTYLVTYSGLSGAVNAAHIHTGAVGSNGGVILPLVPGASPMTGALTSANFTASGAVTSFAQAVAAIRAGTTYFNLHTTANPGGEIRGQIGVTVAPAPTPTPAPTVAPAPTAQPPAPTVPPTTRHRSCDPRGRPRDRRNDHPCRAPGRCRDAPLDRTPTVVPAGLTTDRFANASAAALSRRSGGRRRTTPGGPIGVPPPRPVRRPRGSARGSAPRGRA